MHFAFRLRSPGPPFARVRQEPLSDYLPSQSPPAVCAADERTEEVLRFDPALLMTITYDGTQITADRTLESRVLGLLNKGHVVSVRGYSRSAGLCALCMRSQHSSC